MHSVISSSPNSTLIRINGVHLIAVSNEDVEFVLSHDWLHQDGLFQMARTHKYLHRLIAARAGLLISRIKHANKNKRDNRRSNLVKC